MKDIFGTLAFYFAWQGAAAFAVWAALEMGASFLVAALAGAGVGLIMVFGLNAFGETHFSHRRHEPPK